MSSRQTSPGPPATPLAGGGGAGDAAPGNRSASMIQTAPGGRARRRHMKRTRSAPDCKHGAKKIKVGVCAMDKKAQSKPMCEILARLTAGGEFEVVLFGDKVILNEPVEAWPLCDVLLSWHSEGFPLRKAQQYVELRHPFLINDVHSQDLLLDRRRVYKTLMDHNIPIPRHILVNREPAPAPEPSAEPPADIDELTTSSSSAGSSPRAGGTTNSSSSKAATQAFKPAAPATDGAAAAAAQLGDTASAAVAAASDEAGDGGAEAAAAGEVVLLDPPGFVEEEDYVELHGVRIDKPFVEKPVSGEDHNIHIYYPHSMGGGVKRLFRKVDNKSADYDPHHPGTVRRDGSFIYEEFLTTGGTDVKVYTVGPRYAHAEARKSPVVDGKVNRTPDGKEVRFPVLLSPQEKEIARMVCLAFGQRVCGFDLLRSETGRSYVCDVNGWSFVKNSKKYYDDAAGILRVMILSQLAPQRLTIAPEAPMPLSGLLEEVAAAAAASDGQSLRGPQSVTDGSEDGSGLKMREPSISAAAQPAELGWEELPSVLAVDLDAEGGMKEVGSLQDLTSLDGTYEEEGMGTDDSSSTAGVAASDLSRNLELRCVLAVIRHGDRTPKQKMKVMVTQAPLIALYNKYKDSKGKQAKLKSPGQLQELLDVVRALLADMEAKSSSQRSSRSSTPAPGGQLTEEDKAQEQHEELREKLRIVRTVLEQGGTFSGINRKVQLKPTKWSTPSNSSSSKPPTPAPDAAEQQQGAVAAEQPSQQSPAQPQQQPSQGSKAQPGESGVRSVRTSSTGGGPPAAAAAADGKPQVTELLLILKYGGVLTHSGRAQAEELGKTFRMVMYPRYGPAGGGGFLRLHSTYRHDLKIYSSDEGRVQMSAAAFIKGLLDLEGSSLTPILVSLVTKNASMLDAFGKGASDDILNAKNMLYQHLTWDPEKTVSLCSKLALPLATPAIGVTPPVSPKSAAAADESHSPFFSGAAAQRGAHGSLDTPAGSGGLPASATNSGVSTPTAAGHHSTSFGQDSSLPTTSSCMDLLQQGKSGSGYAALRRGTRASGTGSGTGEQQQQQQGASTPKGSGGAAGGLVAAATANAAGLHAAAGLSKLTHSGSWSAVRAAEARAAALSGIKAMPDQPLALLFQLVELMKVLVDQLREKCLEERVEATPNPHSRSSLDRQEAAAAAVSAAAAGASDKAGPDKAAAAAAAAAAGGSADRVAGGGSLQSLNSARGISSSRYSSLASSPDDWRLDETKPCSGERLLLMFDRWRKLLKSFYNEKKQQFDISKVPDIYDSAKYDAIHNSHLQLSSLADLYRISRQLAAVVVPHEYGLDEQGKLLIGSKICSELLGKLMCDLESMKEESIVTAEIEAQTAAARTEAAAAANSSSSSSSSRHPSRQRVASHASLLEGSNFDAFESEFGHMSVLDGRMRPPKPPGAPGPRHSSSSSTPGQATNWAGAAGAAGGQHSRASQQGTAAAGSDGQQQQGDGGGGGEEQAEDVGEQETLHRLCPTYASDVNSPLRHVRTRIYFTSESHIHSLVNVLRYCHLLCPGIGGSSGLTSYGTAAGSISKASSTSYFPVAAGAAAASTTAAAAAAVPAGSGSSGVAVAAAATAVQQPAAGGASVDAVTTAVAAVSLTDAATPAAAAVSRKPKGTAFASPAAAAAAAASGAAGAAADCGSSGGDAVLAGASSVSSSIAGQQQQPQQLLTPEGQALLAGTDEFDYLTHIVFRMYENKMAAVDAPERFFVEIQFSNGANYDPTVVEPPRHTMPTQPRRLLTSMPGVPLQTFQELAGKFAHGKMAPCNYQLQYALRAPLSSMNTLSKAPTPGMSRAGSANLGPAAAPTPPLPPVPRPPSPVPTAAAAALLSAGPGAAPSAPLPSSVASAAATAVAADPKGS